MPRASPQKTTTTKKKKKKKKVNTVQAEETRRRLETEFLRRAKRGVVMTLEDLKAFCLERGVPLPPEDFLRHLRFKFRGTAVHARFNKPKVFASSAFHRFGVLSIDFAEMSGLSSANFQRKGFVLACETSTQKLGFSFMTRKNLAGWDKALTELMTQFPGAHTVFSDRERALTSKKFQDTMRERFGLSFVFLRGRNKAFHSERYIRFVKTRLSVAMKLNKTKRWSSFLKEIIDDHNARRVPGTRFRRDRIDKFNFSEFLNQRWKTSDAASLWAVSTIDDDALPPQAGPQLWKFNVGDLVYLAIKADYTFTSQEDLKMKTYPKPSRTGNYKRVYQVVDRRLKAAGKRFLTSCYVLKDPKTHRRLHGIFYESELVPCLEPQTPHLA